jgi:hypothetical protein
MQRPNGNTRGWPRPPSDLAALPPGVPVCRGGIAYPRRPACRRAVDLAIAATANIHQVPLITHNTADFEIISDLVNVHPPEQPG